MLIVKNSNGLLNDIDSISPVSTKYDLSTLYTTITQNIGVNEERHYRFGMLDILIDNISVEFGIQVFQQTAYILADLF